MASSGETEKRAEVTCILKKDFRPDKSSGPSWKNGLRAGGESSPQAVLHSTGDDNQGGSVSFVRGNGGNAKI